MSEGISRGLIFSALYLGNLYLGAYTGANIRGTSIWEIISGGLISGGLYLRTNIRGLISGAYISVHKFFKATVDKVPLTISSPSFFDIAQSKGGGGGFHPPSIIFLV